jgi:phosphatidate cytidylyltransferase
VTEISCGICCRRQRAADAESGLVNLKGTVPIQRITTAVIAIPILAAAIQWGGSSLFCWIIAIAAGMALFELLGMAPVQSAVSKLSIITAGVSIVLLVDQYRPHLLYESMQYQSTLFGMLMTAPALLTYAVLLSVLALYPRKSFFMAAPFVAFLGVLYISLFLSYLILLYNNHNGKEWIFFLLIVLWCNDTGAYACGRTLGRIKLSPLVSPNKTVEGAVGGLGFSMIAALSVKMYLLTVLSFTQAAVLGLVIAVSGQAGDLCESALKRHFGCKDSGSMLPGHGGMLDRIDSLLFAAPIAYYCKLMIV